MRRMGLKDALAEVVEPEGAVVVDVGCGDGSLVRHFAGQGARAVGIEISEGQLTRALNAAPVGGESYKVGRGEDLPLEDASADVVLYSNSFHHLPLDAMAPALVEAARVLKPGGRLVAVEPIAEGPYFAAVRPMEDETAVRAAAFEALHRPPPGLELVEDAVYMTTIRHPDAEHFLARMVAVDPARRARLPLVEAEMRRQFATLGREVDGEFVFDQPMRRTLLRRVS
ncbi:MAG TPA: class I SAM-dependent methyltransferase [Azospirillum sp.]